MLVNNRFYFNNTRPAFGTAAKSTPKAFTTRLEPNPDDSDLEKNFFNALVTYIPKSGYRPISDKQTILSVGSYEGGDSITLSSYFGGGNHSEDVSENVNIINLDYDRDAIERGKHNMDLEKKFNPTKQKAFSNIKFIADDAKNIDTNHEIPKNLDIVLFRNHMISYIQNGNGFKSYVDKSYDKLRPGGIMIFVTAYPLEHRELQELLRYDPKYRDKIKVDEPNKHRNIWGDSNILILRK